ncbi:unnamed protein product, partial [Phaeothamnion confervicola]
GGDVNGGSCSRSGGTGGSPVGVKRRRAAPAARRREAWINVADNAPEPPSPPAEAPAGPLSGDGQAILTVAGGLRLTALVAVASGLDSSWEGAVLKRMRTASRSPVRSPVVRAGTPQLGSSFGGADGGNGCMNDGPGGGDGGGSGGSGGDAVSGGGAAASPALALTFENSAVVAEESCVDGSGALALSNLRPAGLSCPDGAAFSAYSSVADGQEPSGVDDGAEESRHSRAGGESGSGGGGGDGEGGEAGDDTAAGAESGSEAGRSSQASSDEEGEDAAAAAAEDGSGGVDSGSGDVNGVTDDDKADDAAGAEDGSIALLAKESRMLAMMDQVRALSGRIASISERLP